MISTKNLIYPTLFILLISNFSFGCKPKPMLLKANELQAIGRTLLDDENNLELITSAAHFTFNFEGKNCKIFAFLTDSSAHNYLQYELDGVYQKRLRIDGNVNEPIIIEAEKEGTHSVTIYKATEAHTGPIFISGIEGQNIKPIITKETPLIEFIGNSITCGAAADTSEYPCNSGFYHDQHNAYMAYGPRTARALGLDFVLSSVSGIGIYRTWNMESPNMPEVFETADFQVNGKRKWDFNKINPTIVSIALGTNDFSNGDGVNPRTPFDSKLFTERYILFVKQVKSHYPNAKIALLSSPMVTGENEVVFQNCLLEVKTAIDKLYPNETPVALHFFKSMQATGCSGHPNVAEHQLMAEQVIPFFKEML